MRTNRFLIISLIASGFLVAQAPPQKAAKPVPVLLLNLKPRGFEPETLTLRAGQYVLVINNQTGVPANAFRVMPLVGNALPEMAAKGVSKSANLVTLTAGTWVVSEPDRPKYTCRITVQ